MKTTPLTRALIAALLATTVASAYADDGELFPNVKGYDQDVPAPVSKPEKALDLTKRPTVPIPPPAPQLPAQPDSETKTPTPATPTTPTPPAPTVHFAPYRESLLAPLLSPESAARFDKDFSDKLKANLKLGSSEKTKAAEDLWKDAEAPDTPADLKRTLWLHSLGLLIKGDSKLQARADKARAVLPLLQEETLPAAQARADAVTELAFGALANASDDLLSMVTESQCKLARMQIQGGFPEEAAASLKIAREAYRYLRTKSDAQRDLIAETGAWVDRATGARASSERWQQTLASKPADTFVNTQLATLNLSLYGDVEKAAKFAAKSDRKEFHAFAAAVKAAFPGDAHDTSPANSLAVVTSLVDLAENAMPLPFDRYSVASLADQKLAGITSLLAPADAPKADALKTRIAAIILKSGLRHPAYTTLASLSADPKAGGAANASKLVLFQADNGTVVKYVKPTAQQNAQAMGIIREEVKKASEKLKIKFVELETDHCLILTDWDASEHGFLKKNVEGAYATIAKQFEFPLNENIFPGKFPVFMFLRVEDFRDFLGKDGVRFTGIFQMTPEGVGYVATYKPEQYRYGDEAVIKWARTLSWCMSYGFLARYHTNKSLPMWVSQGFAAHVGFNQFPDDAAKRAIRRFASSSSSSLETLLKGPPTDFGSQAVFSSVIEYLMAKDKKAFVQFINKLKDGVEAPTALHDTFNMTYADLEKPWKAWVNKQASN